MSVGTEPPTEAAEESWRTLLLSERVFHSTCLNQNNFAQVNCICVLKGK
jgi:hypothetical protein